MKHHDFWGVEAPPFQGIDAEGLLEQSAPHRETLARLSYLLESGGRLAVLKGPSGCGKSTVLRRFAKMARQRQARVASCGLLGVDPYAMLWALAGQLGMNPRGDAPFFCLWRDLTERIEEHRLQQSPLVLLLDEADRAPADVLALAGRLLSCDDAPGGKLKMVLAVETVESLGRTLLQQTDLVVEAAPWTADETAAYVAGRLAACGRAEGVFSVEAVERLYALSGGAPRRVNHLAELCLIAGAAKEYNEIDGELVDSVYAELTAGPFLDRRNRLVRQVGSALTSG